MDCGRALQTSSHRRVILPSDGLKYVVPWLDFFKSKTVKRYAKATFFYIRMKIKNIHETFLQKNAVHKRFFLNLMSMSSRTSLTSLVELGLREHRAVYNGWLGGCHLIPHIRSLVILFALVIHTAPTVHVW